MGVKEKMMNSMMDGLSSEDKKALMEQMMDQFLGSLTDDEKKELMSTMMPRMMDQMKGEGGGPMGGMMRMMMGGVAQGEQAGFDPMEMCKQMMSSAGSPAREASLITPEMSGLFDEWKQQIEEEIATGIENESLRTVADVEKHLKLSRDSVIYFITSLARKGRINLEIAGLKND